MVLPVRGPEAGFGNCTVDRQATGRLDNAGTDAALPRGVSGVSNTSLRKEYGSTSRSARGFSHTRPPDGGRMQLSPSPRILTPEASFFADYAAPIPAATEECPALRFHGAPAG